MPRLSIGIPVYNGQRFLAEALSSLEGQTFGDFDAVICDNASTDATESICRELVARDSRFRYHRNPQNIGAAPNFNRVFSLCPPHPYFKWAAADDVCAPTFLERCVAELDRDPEAVVAFSRTRIVDDEGRSIGPYERRLDTGSPSPAWRYSRLLGGHRCFEVFGVIRRDVLALTPLIGGYSRGDGVLMARLALYGHFVEIEDLLFSARQHAGQSMAMIGSYADYAAWFDPRHTGRRVFPHWRWTLEFLKCIPAGSIPFSERVRCLVWWWRYVWRIRRSLAFEVRQNLRAGFESRRPDPATHAE